MRIKLEEQISQIQPVKTVLRDILGDKLLAIYLHGSAVASELKPLSDIDFLAVINRSMTDEQRKDLITSLLQISGRYPTISEDKRWIEVMVFLQSELSNPEFPICAEFIYGEWLRDDFEAGIIPTPVHDPDNAIFLAQAKYQSIKLFGDDACILLPEISIKTIHQAMYESLPALLKKLRDDERNVLLTLARMWCTATTGKFVTKDVAAIWAIPYMSDHNASILDYARKAYLGEVGSRWECGWNDTVQLAEWLGEQVTRSISMERLHEN